MPDSFADAPPSAPCDGSAGSPGLRRLLALVVAFCSLYQLIYWGFYRPAGFVASDYEKHWFAAKCLFDGTNCYVGERLTLYFNYPQAMAYLFFWLGWFSHDFGEKIWEWTLIAFLLGCWLMAWRCYLLNARQGASNPAPAGGGRELAKAMLARPGLAAAFLVSMFSPATFNMFAGNIDPYNAFMGVAMIALLLRGRERWAGAAWAMFMLCKMLPLALLLTVLLWRRRKFVEGCLCVMASYFLLLLATGRVGYEWYFVTRNVPYVSWHWMYISISSVRLVYYLLGQPGAPFNPAWYPWIMGGTTAFFSAVFIALNLWMRRLRLGFVDAMERALMVVPLFAPLLEGHHYVFILPVLLLHARRWLRGEMTNHWAAVYAMLWIPLMGYYPYVDHVKHGFLVAVSPLFVNYGLVVAAVAELALSHRPRRIAMPSEAVA